MFTYRQLVELERTLRPVKVLSGYIPAEVRDPAARQIWRKELDVRLAELRAGLANSPRAQRASFDRAAERLGEHLAGYRGALRAVGFAAFVTDDGVQHAAPLPAEVPWLVAWGDGIRVAPYLRALKQLRPAVITLVDSRKARLFRYRGGTLELLETIRAQAHVEPPYHMGNAPRQGFKPNTRGRTGTDAAQRELRAGTDRMVADVVKRVVELAGVDGWMLFGGTARTALAAAASLPEHLSGRVMVKQGLQVSSSEAEIARHAADGVSQLRGARDLAEIEALLDRSGAHGNGAMRINATLHALADGAVQELLLTPAFLAEHPDEAEAAVRAAMDQAAAIEIVSDPAARRLDAEAEGIGARLRFVAHTSGASATMS
ncbi:MAG TPA: hypothetical protein VMM18_08535 [Gemmatimonadaceae bacterium]|nr:hypothetical protein [Gemmatimonadaceae bacterium]